MKFLLKSVASFFKPRQKTPPASNVHSILAILPIALYCYFNYILTFNFGLPRILLFSSGRQSSMCVCVCIYSSGTSSHSLYFTKENTTNYTKIIRFYVFTYIDLSCTCCSLWVSVCWGEEVWYVYECCNVSYTDVWVFFWVKEDFLCGIVVPSNFVGYNYFQQHKRRFEKRCCCS